MRSGARRQHVARFGIGSWRSKFWPPIVNTINMAIMIGAPSMAAAIASAKLPQELGNPRRDSSGIAEVSKKQDT
jgi:hypothetical protein